MDRSLRGARQELERVSLDLQKTSRAISQNRLQQARAIDRMARVRLEAARRGEVAGYLEAATREATSILDERETELTALNERARAAREAVDALEIRRDGLHEDVDDAARTLAEREAAVQQALEDSPEFERQLERTRKADAIAISALEKADLAQSDRRRKGEPFESDELFMYLWRRGYGTSEYRANPLSRLLDGWVARLCRYNDARPNYWMLLEIPKRLAEHAAHARKAADAELDALQDIEELAASDGGVPEARAALESLELRQDEIDAEIVQAEQSFRELQAELNRYTAGQDDFLLRALRVFSEAMERRDITELSRLALATMTPEDDAVVDELKELRREYGELEDELEQSRHLERKRMQRIRELEEVRHEFKRRRYDDLHSRFDKGDMIERMIGEVIAGVIKGGALWKTLRRYQRYADAAGEWPDFGSGGIVRPKRPRASASRKRPPTWRWPGADPRRGGGGFRIPRSRGRSRGRGGFRTGGGF